MFVRQGTFAGGEIAPALYGRKDLAKYANSLRRCRGFIVTKHGALVNRPGTRFVAETKTIGKKVRLVPFHFADGQNFVLEFGDLYVRFFKDGGQVLNLGVPYEIVSAYTEAQLSRLKFVQVGDIITICHPSHPPRELRRYANTNWGFATIDFSARSAWTPGPPALDATTLVAPDEASGHYEATWTWQVTTLGRAADGTTFETLPVTVTQEATWAGSTFNFDQTYENGAAVDYNGHHWTLTTAAAPGGGNYKVRGFRPGAPDLLYGGAVIAHWTDGGALATTPTYDPVREKVVLFRDRAIRILWNSDSGPATPGYEVIGYRVYRGRNNNFGYVGETDGATSFVDDGTSPDYTLSPPQGQNPFQIKDWQGNVTGTEYPAAVTFFDQRRIFANTPSRPSTIWLSKVGDFSNFDTHTLATADDTFNVILAADEFEEIRNLCPVGPLLALTNQKRWAISGSQGAQDVLTAVSSRARSKGRRSSSWLDALTIGDAVLAVQANRSYVREMLFDGATETLQGTDLTLMAPHLVELNSIIDWCYAESPFSVVWAVRDDGVLLGLSYLREHEIAAWHWHDTQGVFENVCAVQEGDEDAVYVVVRRTVGGVQHRYVERFCERIMERIADPNVPGRSIIDARKGVFLDCSLTYDGAPETVFTGLGHLEGMSVSALADGVPLGPYTVTGGQIDISADAEDGASIVHVGLAYVSDLETLDLTVQGQDVAFNEKNISKMGFEVIDGRGLWTGRDFDQLREWRQRNVKDAYGAVAPFTGPAFVRLPGSYDTGGRSVLRQVDPLPVTIVGIGREIDVGGV